MTKNYLGQIVKLPNGHTGIVRKVKKSFLGIKLEVHYIPKYSQVKGVGQTWHKKCISLKKVVFVDRKGKEYKPYVFPDKGRII